MGGRQVPEQGPKDDGYNEDGYDESQRAEILETTRRGPDDGSMQTDMKPDLDTEGYDDKDALKMRDNEIAEADRDVRRDRSDIAEDDVQAEFDDDSAGDDQLNDSDDAALNP